MLCFVRLSALPAQNPKMSVDRAQLLELTEKAKLVEVCTKQVDALAKQNNQFRVLNGQLNVKKEAAEADAKTFKKERNQARWTMGGLFLAVLTSLILRIKKWFNPKKVL